MYFIYVPPRVFPENLRDVSDNAGLDREIQQMADVADQLVTTLEKTVEELRRRAGVPPYDPANALTPGAPAPAPAPDFDAQLAAALASVPPPPGPPPA